MARQKFEVPADYDRAEYDKLVVAAVNAKDLKEASRLLDIIEKVDAISVPDSLPEGFKGMVPEVPNDVDSALRTKDGNPKASGFYQEFLYTDSKGYKSVVTITGRRITDKESADWKALAE